MPDVSIEDQFARRLIENIRAAEAALDGYEFRGLRNLIAQRGAVETARYLTDLSNLGSQYDGFSILRDNGLLQFSLEQAVLDFASKGLFTNGHVMAARSRLLIAKVADKP